MSQLIAQKVLQFFSCPQKRLELFALLIQSGSRVCLLRREGVKLVGVRAASFGSSWKAKPRYEKQTWKLTRNPAQHNTCKICHKFFHATCQACQFQTFCFCVALAPFVAELEGPLFSKADMSQDMLLKALLRVLHGSFFKSVSRECSLWPVVVFSIPDFAFLFPQKKTPSSCHCCTSPLRIAFSMASEFPWTVWNKSTDLGTPTLSSLPYRLWKRASL